MSPTASEKLMRELSCYSLSRDFSFFTLPTGVVSLMCFFPFFTLERFQVFFLFPREWFLRCDFSNSSFWRDFWIFSSSHGSGFFDVIFHILLSNTEISLARRHSICFSGRVISKNFFEHQFLIRSRRHSICFLGRVISKKCLSNNNFSLSRGDIVYVFRDV